MPVRRRNSKRHVGLEAWAEYFEFGFDMLNNLYALAGLSNPTDDDARAAWIRYGPEHLANGGNADWAIAKFGHPRASGGNKCQ